MGMPPRARVSPGLPGVVRPEVDITEVERLDAGQRAGLRALLQKFQGGIANATELAKAEKPHNEARRAALAAELVHGYDPVAELLLAIMDMRKKLRAAADEMEKMKAQDPDVALRQRLKLKLRVQYTDQAYVLREFQSFLWSEYSALFPECHKPDAVQKFLKMVEERENDRGDEGT